MNRGGSFSLYRENGTWIVHHTTEDEKRNGYDPRVRPWFAGGLTQGAESVFWSYPYRLFGRDDIGVTASISWKNPNNEAFVIAFDILLEDIFETLYFMWA